MAAGNQDRLTPGEEFRVRAKTWNGLLDAAEEVRRNKVRVKPAVANRFRRTDVVDVKNVSGVDLPKGSVVELTNSLPTSAYLAQDVLMFDGDEADNDSPERFAILLDAHPNGKVREAQVSGVCVALVNVTSTAHKYATVANGETELQSSEAQGPVTLLDTPGSTGSQLCPVLIDNRGTGAVIKLGKTDEAIASETAATVSLYEGTAGSETDTGDNVEAFNYAPSEIESGAWVFVVQIEGEWYAIPLATSAQTGVPFRNDSGETVPAYGCMRVTGSVTATGTEYVTISKPNTTFQRKYLVNGGSTVANGAYGIGTWLSDADWVLYDDASTPAYGESWGPQDASWEIKKWRYGFTIVGNPSGGTTDIVRAVQEEVNEFLGQTDGTHNKGNTGTISVYDGAKADTSINVTGVDNIFANVATAKKVVCRWLGGAWFLVSAEC